MITSREIKRINKFVYGNNDSFFMINPSSRSSCKEIFSLKYNLSGDSFFYLDTYAKIDVDIIKKIYKLENQLGIKNSTIDFKVITLPYRPYRLKIFKLTPNNKWLLNRVCFSVLLEYLRTCSTGKTNKIVRLLNALKKHGVDKYFVKSKKRVTTPTESRYYDGQPSPYMDKYLCVGLEKDIDVNGLPKTKQSREFVKLKPKGKK